MTWRAASFPTVKLEPLFVGAGATGRPRGKDGRPCACGEVPQVGNQEVCWVKAHTATRGAPHGQQSQGPGGRWALQLRAVTKPQLSLQHKDQGGAFLRGIRVIKEMRGVGSAQPSLRTEPGLTVVNCVPGCVLREWGRGNHSHSRTRSPCGQRAGDRHPRRLPNSERLAGGSFCLMPTRIYCFPWVTLAGTGQVTLKGHLAGQLQGQVWAAPT